MSTEMQPKQMTESVIAKLMGLDELAPPQPVQKKPRVLSDNYLRRVSSIGAREKHSEHTSFRLSSEEQKDYIEVFQILETLRRKKDSKMSVEKRKVRSSPSGAKVICRREEFKQSTDVSEECHDAQEVIDSKTDNFPQFFQEPKFTKKANDLQGLPPQLQSGHITVVKLLSPDCRDIGRSRKFWRQIEQGYARLPRKVEDGLVMYSRGKLGLQVENKLHGSRLPTTGIAVLKPEKGKVESAGRCFSSTGAVEVFCPADMKHKEILSVQNGNLHAEVKERKNLDRDSGPARSRSRFSKQISRKMGPGTSGISTTAQTSRIRGSDTLPKESESMTSSMPVSSDKKSQFHCSDEPYMNWEAKKQISEKWKTGKKSQPFELASRSETLDEMPSIFNCESRAVSFVYKPDKCDHVVPDSRGANWNTPSGIRILEVRNDGRVRDLPKSRSFLENFNTVASPNTRTRHKSLQKPSCKSFPLIPHMVSETNHSVEANFVFQNKPENKMEANDSHRQSSKCFVSSRQNYQTLQDPWATQEGHMNEDSEGDLSEQNTEACMSSTSNTSSINVVHKQGDAEISILKRSLLCNELFELESNNCVLPVKDEYSSPRDLPTSVQQGISNRISEIESVSSHCCGTDADPESQISFEDAYQLSPDTVLEPLFKKEISSTYDCFESVDSSLHGLESHFEFMKSEASETYSEGSGMVVSSDEDAGEGSVDDSEENFRRKFYEESRDFSYLVDVLSEAGSDSRKLLGFDSWHSQDNPLSHSVFETLEKKYGEQISWNRSEKRLLFDRINSGLIETLRPCMGMPAWTKPVARRFSSSLSQEMIGEEVWTLLVAQEKEAGKDSEKVLGKDDRWLELSDDVQFIGIEIENFLMDELVADIVSAEGF
ncbi:AFADIN [Salix koriyanagi]|uniref:AFADIN n=1 Tax=Salix koriyanagi TaxID=2511006 RepID=A0A9Q1AE96_9ROSI|nr:AFADIN [Salix koriyanagi]